MRHRVVSALVLAICAAPVLAEPLPYDGTSPVVFVNDIANDVYAHELNMALIATGQVANWKAVVVSGANHPNGWRYNYDSEFSQFQDLTQRARNSGFTFVPDALRGGGSELVKPGTGIYEDTVPVNSPGVQAILDNARAASAGKPLVVVVAGPITAPVSAYLQDNSIANKMVVAWLAYNSGVFGPEHSPDPNVEMDAWAAEIALQRLKLVIFPVHRSAPVVSKARIASDLPDTPLRQSMVSKMVYSTDRDDDAQPSVSLLASTGYATVTTRVRFNGQRGSWNAPLISQDASGPHIYVLQADQNVGSNVWWAAVDTAFDGVVGNPPQQPPQSPQSQWEFCAAEYGFCTFTGTRQVRYGANGTWVVRELTAQNGGVSCSNSVFGDPLPGVVKSCEQAVVSTPAPQPDPVPEPTPPPTMDWVKIADEWHPFTVSGTQVVRYGSGSTWIERTVTDGGNCTNTFFGRDPLPGITKQCQSR